MPHTPLLRSIQRLLSEHDRPGQVRRLTRRRFLAATAAGAAAPWLAGRAVRAASGGPRIAIVGGGIAGLSAAITLADAGIAATVYEASESRVGGRMLSDRPSAPACGACHRVGGKEAPATWADGQVTDVFGELIDSSHATMLGLAKRFNLPLIDLLAAEPQGSTETYHFFGQYYPKAQADADFAAFYPRLRDDLHAAGYPTTYDRSTPEGRRLDSTSIYDYIEQRVPGGHRSPLGALLDVAYNIEYGAETTDQGALNLIYLLAYNKRRSFSMFGESDERYRIAGGVDLLPAAIARYLGLGSRILPGWELVALARASDGICVLTFDGRREVKADIVILAFPFAVLRNLDYSQAGFDALKLRAIRELGAGHNGKLHLQFTSRLWAQPGPWGLSSGSTYGDTGYQCTWESTRGQPGSGGILVNYTGGSVADSMALRHPYGDSRDPRVLADAQRFLAQIEPAFPGLSARWNGRAASSMAHTSRLWNSSYCYWRVGQCQTFGGYERVRQGNVFFAGEHTSIDFQGFMEGGASEGVRAGKEVLATLKGPRAGFQPAAGPAVTVKDPGRA